MLTVTSGRSPAEPTSVELLGQRQIRDLVERFVRSRVPADDVDDVVQTVMVAALASSSRPDDPEQLRRWITGVARNKVADRHRSAGRWRPVELDEESVAKSGGDAESDARARELASWARRQTEGDPEAERTLDWMNREGQGDKLAHIAAEERLPATQVRQRVSRMRRRLRQSWMREMAAVAAVTLLALMWWQSRSSHEEQPVAPRPDPERVTPLEPSVSERARRLRAEAFEQCEREAWSACRDKLDEAKQLEPSGERLDTVAGARRRIERALAPSSPEPSKPEPSKPDSSKPDSSNLEPATPRLQKTNEPVKRRPRPNPNMRKQKPSKKEPVQKRFNKKSKLRLKGKTPLPADGGAPPPTNQSKPPSPKNNKL